MRQGLALLGWVLLPFLASLGGALFPPGEWYRGLTKPSWTPPGSVFGPVWTALYASMGIAAWLVWRRGGWAKQKPALTLFLIQLALNAAWTPLFFGLHNPGVAFTEIVFLWCTILTTMITFWRAHRVAGLMLAPYLVWVSFASALNFAIWRMNG